MVVSRDVLVAKEMFFYQQTAVLLDAWYRLLVVAI